MFIKQYYDYDRKNTVTDYKCESCDQVQTVTSSVYKRKKYPICRSCYYKSDLKKISSQKTSLTMKSKPGYVDKSIPIKVTLETKYLGTQTIKTYWDKPKHRSMVVFTCPTCKQDKETAKSKFMKKKHIHCHDCYQKSEERQVVAQKNLQNRKPIPTGSDSVHWTGERWKEKTCACGMVFQAEKRYGEAHKEYAVYCSKDCMSKYQPPVHPKPINYMGNKLKSSWEHAFAKYLVKLGYVWLYEPDRFETPYGYYTPDFYLPELDIYVEVKGRWREDAKLKYDYFKKFSTIILADKDWLLKQGFRLQTDGKMLPPVKINHLRLI